MYVMYCSARDVTLYNSLEEKYQYLEYFYLYLHYISTITVFCLGTFVRLGLGEN